MMREDDLASLICGKILDKKIKNFSYNITMEFWTNEDPEDWQEWGQQDD